ncbi:MAG: DEAD/DEAH box helicase, partial [Candidatus Obscuribacterales bacterium]|nr:DEAD/DEAH box helicase [Candidatus Obscuribacterales bacterium]
SLSKVQITVLDEADRLLDMGFMPQVRAVMARVPESRQTLMFSATIDSRMKQIAEEFLRDPVIVKANEQKIEPASIDQQFHYIKEAEKENKLFSIIQDSEASAILVFTRTKRKATLVMERLRKLEVQAEEIHGDISQSKRIRTLDRFRRGEFNVLVATDVAARGLDIPSISHVVNYDLPMAAEDYVHRIGRTGRAGRSGVAHSFISADQKHLIQAIHQVMKSRGQEKADDYPKKPIKRSSQESIEYAARLDAGRSGQSTLSGKSRYGKPTYEQLTGSNRSSAKSGYAKKYYGTDMDGYSRSQGKARSANQSAAQESTGSSRSAKTEASRPVSSGRSASKLESFQSAGRPRASKPGSSRNHGRPDSRPGTAPKRRFKQRRRAAV